MTALQRDPGKGPTISERLVRQTSGLLGRRQDRRGFLLKTAVVGSALAVNPWGYIFKPGTAYAAFCGTCSDGWTAFCCTINSGSNSCPPGSFVGGWWKADNAAFCCGAARYMIDCNASCPTSCSCHCSGASCDGRRVCCNQFRYGQCNQQIACYGPVVCRVATCTPPWQYDNACTSTSATDNNTVTHGAPCLPATDCVTPISELYASLGGPTGVLGPVTRSEREDTENTGRYAFYANGSIFQRNNSTPYALIGAIASDYAQLDYYRGPLGYPTTNLESVGDSAKGVFNRFENGVIYDATSVGAFAVAGAIRTVHSSQGGVKGPLGYPTSNPEAVGDAADGMFNRFQGGVVYSAPAVGTYSVLGDIRTVHSQNGGVKGPLGYPTTNQTAVGDQAGGVFNRFQGGVIYEVDGIGTFAVMGSIRTLHSSTGGINGPLGYPTAAAVSDGSGASHQVFQHGSIWTSPTNGTHWLYGPISDAYLAAGGVTSALGPPIGDQDGVSGGALTSFENGAIYSDATGAFIITGPIEDYYVKIGQTTSSLGWPTSSITTSGTISTVTFQNGQLSYDSTTGIVTQS